MNPTNPPEIELYYYANFFFCFGGKTSLLLNHVSENTLYAHSQLGEQILKLLDRDFEQLSLGPGLIWRVHGVL